MSTSHIRKTVSPPPPLLSLWEMEAYRVRLRLFAALFGLLWIGLGSADWFMRFHWFGWQRNLIIPAHAPAVAMLGTGARSVTNEARRGGDLSNLIGIPAVAEKYAEDRPGAAHTYDAYGFRNAEFATGRCDVVVVGDSYAATGPRDEDTFAVQLARALGRPVYNHAAEGRGTFWSIVRFFASERFVGQEPRVLVWPVIEREIDGTYYQGGLFRVQESAAATGTVARRRSGVDWNQLHPSALRRSLPNTSAFNLAAGKAWNVARYRLFGLLNPAVIPAREGVPGDPLLFYGEAVAAQKWDARKRDLVHVTHALTNLSSMATARNMRLVMVLVPDKECVHAAALPDYVREGLRPCVLPDLERKLRDAGVAVVNLKPIFDSAVQRGEMLYWRDDTHWNPAGAGRAAEATAAEVMRLLQEHP